MRLKCTVAGFARLAGLDWEVEVEEVLSVPVVPFSAGEGERLRLLTLAWGEVRESVALESVEFLRPGGGSFLVGAGESESEELEESDDDSEDEGRALSAGSVLESLSESLEEEEEGEEEGEACFLAFLGEGSASDSESELDEELSELDEELEELEELEAEGAFRFSLFVARFFTVFSSSELESEEVSEFDEEEPDEDAVEGGVAFATPVSESLELLLSPSLPSLSLPSLELASDELTSFSCVVC